MVGSLVIDTRSTNFAVRLLVMVDIDVTFLENKNVDTICVDSTKVPGVIVIYMAGPNARTPV